MVKVSNTIQFDARSADRVKEGRRITWQVKGSEERGRGRIHNISTGGMLLHTDRKLDPRDDCILWFDSFLGHKNYIPHNGRLVWHSQKKNRHFCGIEFLQPADYVMPRLRQRVERSRVKSKTRVILNRVLDPTLVLGIVALLGFILWQSSLIYKDLNQANDQVFAMANTQAAVTRTYQEQYYATELKLKNVVAELNQVKQAQLATEAKFGDVSKELEETKSILAQTEALLAKANVDNSQLKGTITSINNLKQDEIARTREDLNQSIVKLQNRNKELNEEMAVIESQLKYYEGNVETVEDGESLVSFYRGKIKEVKARINEFRTEAETVRKAALKERDRVKLLLGNRGFFVKNGAVVKVDQESYDAGVLKNKPAAVENATQAPQNVNIDVQIVE